MSADVINAHEDLPVWTVHGVNWHLDVPLNAYNASFDSETQAYEAASIALWSFKGNDNGLFIVMDEGEDTPLLSTTMIVHLRGTSAEKGFVPFTHLVLANHGFYNEARKMEQLLNKDLEALKEEQIKNEHFQTQAKEQLKSLKKQLNPPKE